MSYDLRTQAYGSSTRLYVEALRAALPKLGELDAYWRVTMMIGTYLYAFSDTHRMEEMATAGNLRSGGHGVPDRPGDAVRGRRIRGPLNALGVRRCAASRLRGAQRFSLPRNASSGCTSAYFCCMSKRLASCGPIARSPTQSETTSGAEAPAHRIDHAGAHAAARHRAGDEQRLHAALRSATARAACRRTRRARSCAPPVRPGAA